MKHYFKVIRETKMLPLSLMIAVAITVSESLKNDRRRKRIWTKQWLRDRKKYTVANLLRELKVSEPQDFKNYLRLDDRLFKNILETARARIEKQNTIMRDAVSAEERLIVTLRYLATGNSFEDLKFSTGISPQLIGKIIPATCQAIYEGLVNEYMQFPKTEEQWKKIAEQFRMRWNFDTCLGAIDGKHVNIVKPPNSGSYFYNYKGKFSVVMMAIVNADYEFIMVHTGTNGKVSDGGILNETKFFELLTSGSLKLPPPVIPEGTSFSLPYTFVADEAFALLENLIKLFPHRGLTQEERIFNYRLSRARRVVENAFGLLASRFRIFHTDIAIDVDKTDYVGLAACVLHNYLRRNSPTYLSDVDKENTETGQITAALLPEHGPFLTSLQRTPTSNTAAGKQTRNSYKEYFNTEGRVRFQDQVLP